MNEQHENGGEITMSGNLKQRPGLSRRSLWTGLVILAAGIVIGSAGTTIVHRVVIHYVIDHPGELAPHLKKHLMEDLDMSPDQSAKVSEILDKHIVDLMEIKKDTVRRVNEQLNLMEAEISPLLDEKQNKKWRSHFERLREHLPPE